MEKIKFPEQCYRMIFAPISPHDKWCLAFQDDLRHHPIYRITYLQNTVCAQEFHVSVRLMLMIQLKDHVHENGSHFIYNTFAQYHFKYFILQFQRYLRQPPNLQVYTLQNMQCLRILLCQG